MAGFRLVNYDKPGPGVSKDASSGNRFTVFFQILFRKFTNLVKVNLLFMIPVVVVLLLMFLIWQFTGLIFIILSPLILLFPFLAGLTFVTRNYAREEHAFIFSDFKEAIQKNWKMFSIHGIITYCVSVLMYFALVFYYYNSPNNKILYVPFAICATLCVLFIFMQYYIPVMIITLDLNLKAIYKNAFILAILGLWKNILLTLGLVLTVGGFTVLALLTGNLLVLALLIILGILLLFSFTSLLCNYTVYPVIIKYVVDPYYKAQEKAEEASNEGGKESSEEIANREDRRERSNSIPDEYVKAEKPKQEKPKSEYVYENGRLIRKSDVEALFDDNPINSRN